MMDYGFAKRVRYEKDGIFVLTEAVVYDAVMETYSDKEELLDDCISIGAHLPSGLTEQEYRAAYAGDDMTEADIVHDLSCDEMAALLRLYRGSEEEIRVVEWFDEAVYDAVVVEVEDAAEKLGIELDEDFTDYIEG